MLGNGFLMFCCCEEVRMREERCAGVADDDFFLGVLCSYMYLPWLATDGRVAVSRTLLRLDGKMEYGS